MSDPLLKDLTTHETQGTQFAVLQRWLKEIANNININPTPQPDVTAATKVLVKVKNSTGSTLTKGSVVNAGVTDGTLPTVTLTDGLIGTTQNTLGLVYEDILDGATGYVITFGLLDGVDTTGFATSGVPAFVSGTVPGGITSASQASTTKADTAVGIIVNANSSTGSILVTVSKHPSVVSFLMAYMGMAIFDEAYIPTLTIGTKVSVIGLSVPASSGAISINFAGNSELTLTISGGDVTFSSQNLGIFRDISMLIKGDIVDRALAWPTGWHWVGAAAPTTIAAGKWMRVSMKSYGSTNSNVLAAYSVEA